MNRGIKGLFLHYFASFKKSLKLFIIVLHQNRFKIWWSEDTCQLNYFKILRILNFITKRITKAVVVSVATNVNNEKVITKLNLTHLLIFGRKISKAFNRLEVWT